MERLPLMQGLSGLVGRKVRDSSEHSVGKLEDVLLDLPRGEVLAALVSPGGNGIILVPPATFRTVSKDKILINADQKLFQSAPRLAQDRNGLAPSGLLEAYRHFRQPATETELGAGALISGTVLLGKPVFGSASEMLGHVQDVILDLAVGRILYLVIQPEPGPNTEGNLYLAPPAALPWDTSGKLLLPANQERFAAGPHYQKAFSTDIIEPQLVTSVYEYYQPERPGAKPGNGQPSAPRIIAQSTAEPAASGAPSRSDSETTKAVMMEILNEGKVALRGEVQITTHQGRVKLAGTARNEREKQSVMGAARRIVGASFVDDNLLVKGKNTTAQVP